MIKGIIFDLDGTLVNTLSDLTSSLNEALKNKGYSLSYSEEETKMMIGSGLFNLCKKAVSTCSSEEKDISSLLEEFKNVYKRRQLEKSCVYPEVKETLEELRKKGIILAVLSNKDDQNSKTIIHHFFGENTFDEVWGKRKDLPLKPDPSSLNLMIESLGLKKEEVIYVGDSPSDIKTGKNASLKTVGVTYGFREKELLEKEEPYLLTSSFKEILKLTENNL